MSKEVKILTYNDREKWNKYLKMLPIEQQDIYFTPEYYKLYENYGDGKSFCFLYKDDEGLALYPFLRNNINNLGYDLSGDYYDIQGAYGYNGVVSSTYSESFKKNFYKSFSEFCYDNKIVTEFTRFHPLLKNYEFSMEFLEISFDRKTAYVDLSKCYDFIFSQEYSPNNRNMIRKAIKKGFKVLAFKNPSQDIINSFSQMYIKAMKRINADKYYFFDNKYFSEIFEMLSENSLIITAECNNEIHAASIIFYFNNYSHYHLSCKMDNADNSANNLILNEAIKFSISNDINFFHLGGGTASEENNPLLKFKENFSKKKADFYIGKKIYRHDIYDTLFRQWEKRFPERVSINKRILCYRDVG